MKKTHILFIGSLFFITVVLSILVFTLHTKETQLIKQKNRQETTQNLPPEVLGEQGSLSRLPWNSGAKVAVWDIETFEKERGRKLDYYVLTLPLYSWDDVRNPDADNKISQFGQLPGKLHITMPILPTDSTSTIELCTQGNYDGAYHAFAKKLLQLGRGDATIAITSDSEVTQTNTPLCFQRIVAAMKTENPNMQVTWMIPTNLSDVATLAAAYPENNAVDAIGVTVFDNQASLKNAMHFAQCKNKPLAILWGKQENLTFIQAMSTFFTTNANHIAYELYEPASTNTIYFTLWKKDSFQQAKPLSVPVACPDEEQH